MSEKSAMSPKRTDTATKTSKGATRKSLRNRQSGLEGALGDPVPINAIETTKHRGEAALQKHAREHD